jgi:hypothetical protein
MRVLNSQGHYKNVLIYFLHFSGGLSGNGLTKSRPFTLPPFLVSTVHFLLLNSSQPGDGDATEEGDSGRAAALGLLEK